MKTMIALMFFLGAFDTHAAVDTQPSTVQKQKVCIKDAKTGKETCRMMRVHKKLEGTPVPKK